MTFLTVGAVLNAFGDTEWSIHDHEGHSLVLLIEERAHWNRRVLEFLQTTGHVSDELRFVTLDARDRFWAEVPMPSSPPKTPTVLVAHDRPPAQHDPREAHAVADHLLTAFCGTVVRADLIAGAFPPFGPEDGICPRCLLIFDLGGDAPPHAPASGIG